MFNNELLWQTLFDHSDRLLLLLDPGGRVQQANQALLRFAGLAPAEVFDRPLWVMAWWRDSAEAQNRLQEAIQQAPNGYPVRYETEVATQDGQTAVVALAIKPVSGDGRVTGFWVEGSDVTSQKEIEGRLEESQALLSEAQREVYLGKIRARQRTRRTTGALRAAHVALAEILDLPQVLETLLAYLAELAPSDSADILLRRTNASLVLYAQRGYDPVPAGRPLAFADFPHLTAVINQNQSLRIQDTQTYLGWRHHSAEAGSVRSWLGIPLSVGNQVIGLCSLNHSQPAHFTDEYRALAETLVAQAAIAIQNARWFTELRASREELRQLAKRIVVVQEEERRRVSRELHDEAGQSLTALKISLEMVYAELPPSLATIGQSLAEAIELTDETMERIRRLAHGLRPPALDALGLSTALEGLCREVGSRVGLETVYEGCELPRLPDAMATSLYRFVQEALTNVIKHADASRVVIRLRQREDQLCLSVADDGRGLPAEEQPLLPDNSPGLGLVSMAERLTLLGGRLTIESQPGQGTRLMACAPLPKEVT
jgi:PAS domain S-box-containing protein